MTHHTPTSDPKRPFYERVAKCGVVCRTGARDGFPSGSSNLENVDCPECLAASRQTEMFK